jgi:peptidoglycan hydrolase-like protein with peptidoglycan-binding domain
MPDNTMGVLMKQGLIFAFALLFACSHGSSFSGGGTSTAPSEQQTSVVQPSDLSPEQVRLVQRALSDRGFALDLSGRFDERTQTALGDFQRARGLPATGNLNQPTVEALGLDPREVMPVRGADESSRTKTERNRAGEPEQKPADAPAADQGSRPPSSY